MDIATQLQALESLLGCRLCLHDHARLFPSFRHAPGAFSERFSHRKTYPRLCGRQERAQCLDFCMAKLCSRIQQRRERAFLKRCPFGALEIVAPIYQNGEHTGTLFAGIWRPRCSHLHVDAPEYDPQKIRQLLQLLPLVADGIAAETARNQQASLGDCRAAVISQYIGLHFRSSASLAALAAQLGLSMTRAGHLVKELFGKTFQELLLAKRLEAATHLLLSTDYRIKQLAPLAGFASAEHFTRLFHKKYSISPGAFRKQAQTKY